MRATLSLLWPDHRTVWRWHFFAGLFCLPFVAFLCLTGSVYLFKPQIENWIDWRYDHLELAGPGVTPEREVRAALAAVPNSRFLAYELPRTKDSAARVILDRSGEAIRVYVHPASLAILKQVPEEARFERIVFKLHGQLLLGNVGSAIMEMVASWTLVLIITGLYLWWPRGTLGAGGVAYPRLAAQDRTRWRDLHAVTGSWVSLCLVLFLVSGLPWSFVWGHVLSRVESSVGRMTAIKSWEIGAVPMRAVMAGHPVSMPGMDMDAPAPANTDALSGLDAVVAAATRLGFPAPVLITPPGAGGVAWHVRSDTQDRPLRIGAQVDPAGRVLSVERFSDKGVVDRAIGYGVAAHEGHLFGWANQALNLLVAACLLTMSVAALILWSRRRPPGHLGVPRPLPDQRVGMGAVAAMIVLGIVLPELGVSLLLLALASFCMRRRDCA